MARVPVTADGLASVWTGHDTVVLDGLSMRPVFTATGTRGPGVAIGARMLIPDDAGYLVVDAATGQRTGHLAVARETHDAAQAIVPAALGDAVVEQRGDTLAVYGP